MREGWTPPKVNLNIVSGRGGLGDSLARIPAFKYMHDHYEHVSATIYIQDGWLELTRFLLPETPRRRYKPLSEAHLYTERPLVEFNMERLTTLHLHLTKHAFLILMDMLPPSEADMQYPLAPPVYMASKLPEKMVVFTTDYTAPTREWPAIHINELARRVREAGLTPVLLGRSKPIPTGLDYDPVKPHRNDGIDASLFLDFRDKTTLTEALGIMQKAKAVVGVDNGLLHLAHYTDVPVVAGFTSLKAVHRLPFRPSGSTICLEAQVPCGGCQSKGFAINTDWRECLFNDYACTLTMSADRFLGALRAPGVLP